MERTIALLTGLPVLLLTFSCATTSSFYGDHPLKPSEVGEVLVVVDDGADNSVFKGNEFLQSAVVKEVCTALQAIGVRAINGIGKDPDKEGSSHMLVLYSQGVTTYQGYHQKAPMTFDSYRTGMDSRGTIYTYSVPQTVGGGGTTYTVREVQAAAMLLERSTEGGYRKVCQSFSQGDGMNPIERRFNMSSAGQVLGYQKNLDAAYSKVFVSAATEMFTKK